MKANVYFYTLYLDSFSVTKMFGPHDPIARKRRAWQLDSRMPLDDPKTGNVKQIKDVQQFQEGDILQLQKISYKTTTHAEIPGLL